MSFDTFIGDPSALDRYIKKHGKPPERDQKRLRPVLFAPFQVWRVWDYLNDKDTLLTLRDSSGNRFDLELSGRKNFQTQQMEYKYDFEEDCDPEELNFD